MLLTITTTAPPATDLGYLLHKNPARLQTFELAFGHAHVFYPEAQEDRCTAALLVEVDPISLVRGRGHTLDQYVNDRPYAASSFLSVAIAQVFGSALSGTSRERPELAERVLPLSATLSALPCRGGEDLLRRLFEPLGYVVSTEVVPLDEVLAAGVASRYLTVRLTGQQRLVDLLSHLYVLVPVLDDDKHYWVGDDEVAKLVRHGEAWLAAHPERELVAARYLKHQRSLARQALAQLEEPHPEVTVAEPEPELEAPEAQLSLNEQRLGAVLAVLKQSGAKRVLDLGCGEGKLLRLLLKDPSFQDLVGVDVSHRALEIAAERLHLSELPERTRARIQLLQGALTYRDLRLAGYDAATVIEVIEHLDPPRLHAFERALFEFARPRLVVLTTPNAEYNVRYENLEVGQLRHHDHRFEWTRAEFVAWAERAAARYAYRVRFLSVGTEDLVVGAPTQMAVFEC